MKVGLPLMNAPLAKSTLIALGLAAPVWVEDARIHKKILRSEASGTSGLEIITLIMSSREIENVLKTDKSSKDFSLFIKGITQKMKQKKKEMDSWHVIRHIKCRFIRKYASWQRNDQRRLITN